MVAVVALPFMGTALATIPMIGAQLNTVMLNCRWARPAHRHGADDHALRAGHGEPDRARPAAKRKAEQPQPLNCRTDEGAPPQNAAGPFLRQASARLTMALAAQVELAGEAFLHQRHHPAHVLDRAAPVSADDRVDRGLRPLPRSSAAAGSARSPRLRPLRRGQLLAAALAVHVDRFAALLDHLLQHLGDEHVVVRRARCRCAARCRDS